MNIIQQQELARNSSEQQLIDLASQPNPSIMPPYLVTGELMRRKSIREKFAQAPQQSVSEEVLAEAIGKTQPKQAGIGSLAPQRIPPQEEVMSESITETGVAQLPAPNIGQNYANGGIVGYAWGGPAIAAAGTGLKKLWDGRKWVWEKIKANPKKSIIGGGGLAGYSMMDSEDEIIKTPDGEEVIDNTVATTRSTVPAISPSEAMDTSRPDYSHLMEKEEGYGKRKADEYREFLGVDPNQAKYTKRLQKLEQRNIDDESNIINEALITGGLAMAGGTSQNFLSNLTTGLGEGADAYREGRKDVRKAEADLFALETEIGKVRRAEEVAIGTKGFDSQERVEASNRLIKLEEVKAERELQKLKVTLKVAEIGSTIYGYNKNAQKDILNHANSLGLKEVSAALNSLLLNETPTKDQQRQINHMKSNVADILARAENYVLRTGPTGPAGNIPNSGQTTADGQIIHRQNF